MKISRFTVNPFGENCYVAWDDASRVAVVIDPGMLYGDELDAFYKFISDNHLTVTDIVSTHLHLDHIFGVNNLRDKLGAKLSAHPDDAPLGLAMPQMAAEFHLRGEFTPVSIDIQLRPGDRIPVGSEYLEVIHVPGHSRGSIALYAPESGVVFTGDALFAGSIGRTDLQGGNHAHLLQSIKQNLMSLPGSTIVLPGHGGETTIAEEKNSNPFLK